MGHLKLVLLLSHSGGKTGTVAVVRIRDVWGGLQGVERLRLASVHSFDEKDLTTNQKHIIVCNLPMGDDNVRAEQIKSLLRNQRHDVTDIVKKSVKDRVPILLKISGDDEGLKHLLKKLS